MTSTTTFFYDGQIRRYLLQIVRLLSNFAVRYGDGTLVRVPVMYGDPDRQAAHIINQNSENTVQSAPRIAVYMSELELDSSRLADSSFVGKINIRERSWDPSAGGGQGDYTTSQGNSYTVERLMPTPYRLTVKVDIWASSIDQKLQILEQILMLFNPSLEIQTTDNYVDWTSLSVVDLTSLVLSSRTVPTGTSTDIDVATLTLATPIWISPPAKVKKLGVVTNIISSIFTDKTNEYGDYASGLGVDPNASFSEPAGRVAAVVTVNTVRYSIEVAGNSAKLIGFDGAPIYWSSVAAKLNGTYTAGLSRIYLETPTGTTVVGSFSFNPLDDSTITINWDQDTFPKNTEIISTARASTTTFDAVIDPTRTGPRDPKLPELVAGSRYLIIGDIGGSFIETVVNDSSTQIINTGVNANIVTAHRAYVDGVAVSSTSSAVAGPAGENIYQIVLDRFAPANSQVKYELYTNQDGPDAWKNTDGTDFVAKENDLIEWDGNSWKTVFESALASDQIIYQSNIFTGTQFVWAGSGWGKSVDGVYRAGEWKLVL